MEFKWKKSIEIPEGLHSGEIVRITYRDEPYEYTDIWVKLDELDIEIKYGCPSVVSEKSKLGRLLIDFGAIANENESIEPESFLMNKKVTFMTINKKNKDGVTYAEIVEDSLKPRNV